MALPPASAFQTRPACTSTKCVADGNASFCACATDRYWTACAAEVTDTSAAAGAVHLIHCDMPPPLEKEPDAAEDRVRVGAGRIAVDHLLVGRLEHQLGRGEDGETDIVELQMAG